MDYDKLLRKYLNNEKRIVHSISTAEHMRKHADLFGIDKDKAYFVGIFHDIGKELSNEMIIEYSESLIKRGEVDIAYFEFKKNYPSLLHGAASAEIVLREFKEVDIDEIYAIMQHTTGGVGLSKLSKYMFVFDYCEPLRTHECSRKIYRYLIKQKKLNKAYFYAYYYLLKSVIKRERTICPESIDGYNEALKIYKG